MEFRHVGTLSGGFVRNLTDLTLGQVGGQVVLVGATHVGGGITSWTMDDPGRLAALAGLRDYPDSVLHMAEPQVLLLDRPGGVSVVTAGLAGGADMALALNGDGSFGGADATLQQGRLPADLLGAGSFQTAGGLSLLYTARHDAAAITIWRQGTDGMIRAIDVAAAPPGLPPDAQIDSVVPLRLGGVDLLICASTRGNFLSAHRVLPDGTLAAGEFVGLGRGTGFNGPRDICAVEVEGKHYLVVSSAYSSSLTTVRILPGGGLVPVDHVIDERTTRFQSATVMESVTVDGRSYVVVGGADDGLSLFTITPDGRFVHLATVADETATTLQDVSALAIRAVGGKIVAFAASATETGVTQFEIDVGRTGQTRQAGDGVCEGTADDDLIQAGRGTTMIRGGAGDDILIAGTQPVTLTGGAGADRFMPTAVAGRILIRDFDPGVDRLDLSMMGMCRSTAQITFVRLSSGIRLKYGETVIDIRSADGRPLAASAFDDSMFPVAHYQPADVQTTLIGTARGDLLQAARGGSTAHGMDGDDTLLGSLLEDYLTGGNGHDRLVSRDGADTVWGGAGNDWIRAGGMDDIVLAGADHDVVMGESGDDRISGQIGNDSLYGGAGNDRLNGGGDADYVNGESGDDTLFGMGGDDRMVGAGGNDVLLDYWGNNVFRDFLGNNSMWAGNGNDRMFAGAGSDTIRGGNGDNLIVGGDGRDNLGAGSGADLIFGDGGNDLILGGAGRDWLIGGAGDDIILGGADGDRLVGSDGHDALFGEDGDDTLLGGVGNDTLRGNAGADRIYDSAGNNRAFGGAGNDTIATGEGADLIAGEDGDDLLIGGEGDDLIDGGAGADALYGSAGNDTLAGGAGTDRLRGGAGDDRLLAGDDADWLSGGSGADLLSGGAGDDELFGEEGNDTLLGGGGADTLTGGEGADVFVFAAVSDSAVAAPDTIRDFESGADRIDLSVLALHAIGVAAFSGQAGELRWTAEATGQRIEADLDGDGLADLSILLAEPVVLTEGDFLL